MSLPADSVVLYAVLSRPFRSVVTESSWCRVVVSVVPSLCAASVVQHSCVSAAAVSCCRSVLRDRPCAEPFSWSFRDSAASVISCVTQCSVFFASLLRQCCVILLPHSVQRLSFEFSVGLQSMGNSVLLQVECSVFFFRQCVSAPSLSCVTQCSVFRLSPASLCTRWVTRCCFRLRQCFVALLRQSLGNSHAVQGFLLPSVRQCSVSAASLSCVSQCCVFRLSSASLCT